MKTLHSASRYRIILGSVPAVLKLAYAKNATEDYLKWGIDKIFQEASNKFNMPELTAVLLQWLQDRGIQPNRIELSNMLWLIVQRDCSNNQRFFCANNPKMAFTQRAKAVQKPNGSSDIITFVLAEEVYDQYRANNYWAKIKKIKPCIGLLDASDGNMNDPHDQLLAKIHQYYIDEFNGSVEANGQQQINPYDILRYYPTIRNYTLNLQNWLQNAFIEAYHLVQQYPNMGEDISYLANYFRVTPKPRYVTADLFNVSGKNGPIFRGPEDEKQAILKYLNLN